MMIIIQYQLCPLADKCKHMRVKTIAGKKLARLEEKEEGKKLGGMTLASPPCFEPSETPMVKNKF